MDSSAYSRDPLHQNALNLLHSMTLHGIHCIQSGCFGPCCKKSTAFNHAAGIHYIQSCCRNLLHSIMLHKSTAFIGVPFIHAAWNQLHSITLHKVHCIQSGCIGPRFMESTACNHAAWSPLHSITLHGIHCIQSGCILPGCMEYTAFNHAASISLHSIGIHCAMMHGIHCIQLRSIGPRCIESTALNGDPFSHDALYTLRSIRMHFTTLHGIHGIQSGCLWPCCIKSTSFNHAACNPPHSIGMFWDMLQKIPCIKSG